MTTIATDGKSMAGDTQTSNGKIWGFGPKVFRTKDGKLFGTCGDTAQCIKFRRWMMEGGECPDFAENFEAMILNPDGSVDWFDDDCEMVRVMSPMAIGSGAEFAVGAMEAGASPEQAVEIAARRDTGTGGEITALQLETKA